MSHEPTVYVVDDDHAAASSVAALVASVALKVATYDSAEAFLAAYDGRRHGCLVLDIRLQGMSGLALQEALLAEDMHLPIIIISGHADGELSAQALQNGAVACFEKPYDGNALCEAVRGALARQ